MNSSLMSRILANLLADLTILFFFSVGNRLGMLRMFVLVAFLV